MVDLYFFRVNLSNRIICLAILRDHSASGRQGPLYVNVPQQIWPFLRLRRNLRSLVYPFYFFFAGPLKENTYYSSIESHFVAAALKLH